MCIRSSVIVDIASAKNSIEYTTTPSFTSFMYTRDLNTIGLFAMKPSSYSFSFQQHITLKQHIFVLSYLVRNSNKPSYSI